MYYLFFLRQAATEEPLGGLLRFPFHTVWQMWQVFKSSLYESCFTSNLFSCHICHIRRSIQKSRPFKLFFVLSQLVAGFLGILYKRRFLYVLPVFPATSCDRGSIKRYFAFVFGKILRVESQPKPDQHRCFAASGIRTFPFHTPVHRKNLFEISGVLCKAAIGIAPFFISVVYR